MQTSSADNFISATEHYRSRNYLFPSAQAFKLYSLWARAQLAADSSENKTSLTANSFIHFKQNSNAAHKIQSIGADMGGQHQEWGCVGDAISRNTRSIIIRLEHI